MVFTSNYSNNINGNKVSISYDGGIECNFKGYFLPALSNRNKYNCEKLNETNLFLYIKNYYDNVLSMFDAKGLIDLFDSNVIFVDYNDNIERHILACWLEIELGITVFEILIDDRNIINLKHETEKYKNILLNIIKQEEKSLKKEG